MNAPAVARTESARRVSTRQALFALFDAVRDASAGYSNTTVYGDDALFALLVWTELHGIAVEQTNSGTVRTYTALVDARSRNVTINVQVNTEGKGWK